MLVERGAAAGMRRHDLQVVLTIVVMRGRLVEDGGVLRMSAGYATSVAPRPSVSSSPGWPRDRRGGLQERRRIRAGAESTEDRSTYAVQIVR